MPHVTEVLTTGSPGKFFNFYFLIIVMWYLDKSKWEQVKNVVHANDKAFLSSHHPASTRWPLQAAWPSHAQHPETWVQPQSALQLCLYWSSGRSAGPEHGLHDVAVGTGQLTVSMFSAPVFQRPPRPVEEPNAVHTWPRPGCLLLLLSLHFISWPLLYSTAWKEHKSWAQQPWVSVPVVTSGASPWASVPQA